MTNENQPKNDEFTHLDEGGNVRMVDVGHKELTERMASAAGCVTMSAKVVELLRAGDIAKGNVLSVAKTAGIMAAKRTAELIPLCHPLILDHIDLEFELLENQVAIVSRVKMNGRTGAEMEALTAVSVAALTIYDMCKAVDKSMTIEGIQLLKKTGGKNGTFVRAKGEGRG